MPEWARRFRFAAGLAGPACLAFLVATCLAQAQQQPSVPSSAAEDSLKTFLRSYLGTFPGGAKTAQYSAAFVDLSGHGKQEVIVYVSGRDWCAGGGCEALILARQGASYRVVTKTTITWPPIRVLRSTSHGWRNISVWVRGGGVRPGYEAELRFDGTTYASNPSVPPARPLAGKMAGEVVLSGSEEATPLYQ